MRIYSSSDKITFEQLVSKLDEFYDQAGIFFEEMYNDEWWDYTAPFTYEEVYDMLSDFVYEGDFFDLDSEADYTPGEFIDDMLNFIFNR